MNPCDEEAKTTDSLGKREGRFQSLQPRHSSLDGNRSKSTLPSAQPSLQSNFPNLSNLLPLLTMSTINQYPKLCLLLYESLKPFICIFDNEYLSFIDFCTKHKLLDFNKFSLHQKNDTQLQIDRSHIRRFGNNSQGRQMAFQFFLKNYRSNLMSKASRTVKSKKSHGGRDEEMSKAEASVNGICDKLGQLSKNELSSIFDFLVEMC